MYGMQDEVSICTYCQNPACMEDEDNALCCMSCHKAIYETPDVSESDMSEPERMEEYVSDAETEIISEQEESETELDDPSEYVFEEEDDGEPGVHRGKLTWDLRWCVNLVPVAISGVLFTFVCSP